MTLVSSVVVVVIVVIAVVVVDTQSRSTSRKHGDFYRLSSAIVDGCRQFARRLIVSLSISRLFVCVSTTTIRS